MSKILFYMQYCVLLSAQDKLSLVYLLSRCGESPFMSSYNGFLFCLWVTCKNEKMRSFVFWFCCCCCVSFWAAFLMQIPKQMRRQQHGRWSNLLWVVSYLHLWLTQRFFFGFPICFEVDMRGPEGTHHYVAISQCHWFATSRRVFNLSPAL